MLTRPPGDSRDIVGMASQDIGLGKEAGEVELGPRKKGLEKW